MCSCGGKKPSAPKPSAVMPCGDKPWDVQCILDIFCGGDAQDRAVVGKLPKLTITRRETKQVHFKRFKGGTWVDDGFTSGGSAQGTKIAVNADTNCCDAAATFFHEVTHTDQPATMAGSQREYDAYVQTEQWRIKKNLPPHSPKFRKRVVDPNHPGKMIEVPDPDAIKAKVDATYAYNPPTPVGGGVAPPSVVAMAADGVNVQLSDGTTRAPTEGDAFRLPDTGGKALETVDPAKWKCS